MTKYPPFTAGMTMRDGKATAYVCRDFACRQPVATVGELRAQLEGHSEVGLRRVSQHDF